MVVAESSFGRKTNEGIGTERRGKKRQTHRQPVHIAAAKEVLVVIRLLFREIESEPDNDQKIADTDDPIDMRDVLQDANSLRIVRGITVRKTTIKDHTR